MTHLRCEWTPDPLGESDTVEVEVLAGYAADSPLNHAGVLRLHATDLNRVVRALELGASFEAPAFTFDIVARPGVARPLARAVGVRR